MKVGIKKIAFILVAAFILCLLTEDSAAQNLVTNGSFANNATGWIFFAPATATEAYLAETSYGGTNTTNIVAEVDNECNLRQTNIGLVPGTVYWFSFRRTRRTGNGAAPIPSVMRVKVYDGATIYVDQVISSTNPSWNWQCDVFQFTATTSSITIDFENITATTLGTIVDDITVTPFLQDIVLSGSVCQGGTISMSAPLFSNDPNAVYSNHSWTGPNGFTSTGSVITINNAQPQLHNGSYICTMTLNECLTVTGTYNLSVAPTIINIEDSICEGNTYDFYGRQLYNAGIYDTLIVSANNACDSHLVLNLKVLKKPVISISPKDMVQICEGDTVWLRIDQGEADVNYQWLRDDIALSGETGPAYAVTESGSYRLSGERSGCTNQSAAVKVTVSPVPVALIGAQAEVKCAYDTVVLHAFEGENYYYLWEPISIFSASPTHAHDGATVTGIFKKPSTTVTVTVFNEYGCFRQDSIEVYTKPCCTVMIPTAFSPNQDGMNDYFIPVTDLGQTIISFIVYNRFGNVVYQYPGSSRGWNGKYDGGKDADTGSYMYMMTYECSDGKVYSRKGDVVLIR
jgi:gliding motility-associated-like protein